MSVVNRIIANSADYAVALEETSRAFDLKVRFPHRPHKKPAAHYGVLDWDWFLSDDFPAALKHLAKEGGNDSATLISVEPRDLAVYDTEGFPAAFIEPSTFSAQEFNQIIIPKYGAGGWDGIFISADVIALFDRALRWSIWAERTWELAAVCADFDLRFLEELGFPIASDFEEAIEAFWPAVETYHKPEEAAEFRKKAIVDFGGGFKSG